MAKRLTIKIKQIKCIEENEASDDEIYIIGRSVEWEGSQKLDITEQINYFPSEKSTVDFDKDDPPYDAQDFLLVDHRFDNQLRVNLALWEEDSGRLTMAQLEKFYEEIDKAIVDAFNEASEKAGVFSLFVDAAGVIGKPFIRTSFVLTKLVQKIWKISDPDDLIQDRNFLYNRDMTDFEKNDFTWLCRGDGANYEVTLAIKLETVN
ncbi:MAG: hypothetical protein GW808_06135 [Sphingomonadales bacterium]|nr:hypothetical protein [Sphingomonadales bacterium]PIX66473.1 MAG: hypothetical protein COZ43_06575 [Sphingomonadales bacterium CG_4_10_14_3_um_filter_58_15]NCO48718.1 hypothetical protein [Sphingomonadales bacterium]NCP00135.1 hypothetical protein [Sphingomonadales bacterium]NCP27919.1 hypothetical protein [Sphingomonadales bacterium]